MSGAAVTGSGHRLSIEGELTIYRAAELCDVLKASLAAVPQHATLGLDLRAVTEMDSAGAQLLLAAQKSALATGRALHVAATSAAVDEVLAILRLATQFAATPPSAASTA
jgi:anti-sigma B factor antagonist